MKPVTLFGKTMELQPASCGYRATDGEWTVSINGTFGPHTADVELRVGGTLLFVAGSHVRGETPQDALDALTCWIQNPAR
jgi:hypothetical protein